MKSLNRRDFLRGAAAAVVIGTLPKGKVLGANDKVRLGIMGLGGRGTFLMERFMKRPDVEIACLCDVDTRRYARAREIVEEATGKKPNLTPDFRKMLEDKSIDAIVNATPDHWHGLGTIMACQAGKDVYVEKPLAHNIWEGRKMVEAARKYKRVVQVGMQSRSAAYFQKAIEYLRSGKIGDILFVRVLNMMRLGKQAKAEEAPVSEGLDYDMWCGPAPKLPYRPGRWWTELWDFTLGAIHDDAVHQIDLARALIDKPYPDSVCNAGGVLVFQDGREIPDTQFATYEYGRLTMHFEGALWPTYMTKTPGNLRDRDAFPQWQFNGTKIELYGTEGFMIFGRHGDGWQAYNGKAELVQSEYGRQGDNEHQANFIECIRTRNKPVADVEEGHLSTLLCHAANISYRVGKKKLKFDGKTEKFTDCEEANKFIRRECRKPWIIPEEV